MKIETFFVGKNFNHDFFWKAKTAFHFKVSPAFHFKSSPDENRAAGFPFQSGLQTETSAAIEGLKARYLLYSAHCNPK